MALCLAADHNLDAFGVNTPIEQVNQKAFLFEGLHDSLHLLQVGELGLLEEVAGTIDNHITGDFITESYAREGNGTAQKVIVKGLFLGHLGDDFGTDLLNAQTGHGAVQVIGDLLQVTDGQVFVNLDQFVLYQPGLGDEDGQNLAG